LTPGYVIFRRKSSCRAGEKSRIIPEVYLASIEEKTSSTHIIIFNTNPKVAKSERLILIPLIENLSLFLFINNIPIVVKSSSDMFVTNRVSHYLIICMFQVFSNKTNPKRMGGEKIAVL
jgi:hypothetical protein